VKNLVYNGLYILQYINRNTKGANPLQRIAGMTYAGTNDVIRKLPESSRSFPRVRTFAQLQHRSKMCHADMR
jgi:hypothetical protein